MARLFGTDGVRGVANSQLTPELAFLKTIKSEYSINSTAAKITARAKPVEQDLDFTFLAN